MELEHDKDSKKEAVQEEELEEGLEESMDGSDAPAETQPGSGRSDEDKPKK